MVEISILSSDDESTSQNLFMIPIIINNPLIKHNAEESTVRFGNKNLHTTREIKNLAKAKLSNKERKRLTNDTFGKLEFDFNDLDEIDLISPGFYLEGFKFSKVKIDSTFFKQNYTEMKNQQNNGITSKRNLNGYLSLNRSDKNLIKNLKKKKTSLANLKNFIFDFQNLVLNYISNMEKKVLELSNRRELKSSTFNQKTANNTFGEEVIFVDAYEKEGDSASVNSDDFILIKKEDLEWVVENFKMEYFEVKINNNFYRLVAHLMCRFYKLDSFTTTNSLRNNHSDDEFSLTFFIKESCLDSLLHFFNNFNQSVKFNSFTNFLFN